MDYVKIRASLLTGGDDPTYALPLAMALASKGINLDFIGNNHMQHSEILKEKNINYLNLRGDQNPNAPMKEKIFRILKYYFKLIKYTLKTDSKLFHILWLNKFIYFDRTILNVYYKILGKKIILTAHNVNIRERDGNDTLANRLTLKFMYYIVDHIFVHTNKMKLKLIEGFNVKEDKITIIPFGINNIVFKSNLTRMQAREKINLKACQKVLLFFGQIAPYKGLEYLVLALFNLKEKNNDIKLIIAGSIKKGYQKYWEHINKKIEKYNLKDYIITRIEFIPDKEVEVYFKATDVLILPYKSIFQSGPLFLSYNFGIPVIATDVGSFKEDVIEDKTGFICKSEDSGDLANKIDMYFKSNLYKDLEVNKDKIIMYANEKYSWDKIAKITCSIYKELL